MNLSDILTKVCAEFRFNNGKVFYFSTVTQHGEADTLEDAVNIIVETAKKYNYKNPLYNFIEKYEKELS